MRIARRKRKKFLRTARRMRKKFENSSPQAKFFWNRHVKRICDFRGGQKYVIFPWRFFLKSVTIFRGGVKNLSFSRDVIYGWSLRFSLVMLDMSKNVEIAILTAKVRKKSSQKKSQQSWNFFFETGRFKPFRRTRARFHAAYTHAYGNLFVQNGSKRLF